MLLIRKPTPWCVQDQVCSGVCCEDCVPPWGPELQLWLLQSEAGEGSSRHRQSRRCTGCTHTRWIETSGEVWLWPVSLTKIRRYKSAQNLSSLFSFCVRLIVLNIVPVHQVKAVILVHKMGLNTVMTWKVWGVNTWYGRSDMFFKRKQDKGSAQIYKVPKPHTMWAMMLSLCREGCRLKRTMSPSIRCLSTMSPHLSSWAILSRFPYFKNLNRNRGQS